MKRREFIQGLGLGAGWVFSSQLSFLTSAKAWNTPQRLSYLAYRGVSFEGDFQARKIEGEFPRDLSGTLFRIGPGTKNSYGTPLKHLFDGDGYLTSFKIQDGKVLGRSKFINTSERQAEAAAQAMLYYEFGTKCPGKPKGLKNAPNVHVVNFAGQLLTLSDASFPVAVDAETLETKGAWNFGGTLGKGVAFTAHPKIDPVTGDGYTFGITQGLGPELKIYHFEALTGKLQELYSIDLGGYYMIHDFMVTENYLVFLVPPIKVDLMGAATLQAPVSDLLQFQKEDPFRILVLRKDQSKDPQEFLSSPGGTGFHHCNAFEENGQIIFDSILSKDMQTLDLLQQWSAEKLNQVPASEITRFTLDLNQGVVVSRQVWSDGRPSDFPCLPPGQLGKKHSHVYAIEAQLGTSDPLCTNGLVCWDLETLRPTRVQAESSEMFGELVFAENYLIHLGFDRAMDETFLDVRKPLTLELISRVWLGRYLPLGFHGSFLPVSNSSSKI